MNPDYFILNLPWPSPYLNENRKGHWAVKARAKREARRAAWALALQEKLPNIPGAILEFKFFPPDRRKRDTQNLPGMMKAYIDGISDAMGCDDNGFKARFPDHLAEPVKGGAVLVVVREGEADNWRSIGSIAAEMTEAAEHERMVRSQTRNAGARVVRAAEAVVEVRGVDVDG